MPKLCTLCDIKHATRGPRKSPDRGTYLICTDCNNLRPEQGLSKYPLGTGTLCTFDTGGEPLCIKLATRETEHGSPLCSDHAAGIITIPIAKSPPRVKLTTDQLKANQKQQHECPHEGCARKKQWGYESDSTRRVCGDHIDDLLAREGDPIIRCIKARKCKEHNRVARYGSNGKTTHCDECKSSDMILITKCCEAEGCNKKPRYGIRNRETGRGIAVRCTEHVEKGDVAVGDQLCRYHDANGLFACDSRANKGTTTKEFCGKHKRKDDKDFSYHKVCELCQFLVINPRYKPHCTHCYFYLNPEDSRIRNYKTKEHAFMVPLKEEYPNMTLDKKIQGGCSRRRPDGFIECNTHVVIVEIDEDQHVRYDATCENRRIMEIYQDVAHRPIIFVRLNPDKYEYNGKKISSVFYITKSGRLTSNKTELNRRLEMLKEAIVGAIASVPTKAITVVQLCFTSTM